MRPRQPVWSSAARTDLFDDYTFIAQDNPQAADRFVLDLYRKVESFATAGLTGIDRNQFGSGIRSLSYRDRIIFFTISDTELTVLRLVHGHQDISPDLFKTDET
ncbi:MAG: type II toxin-antitoxin system RelE/ParE family toxin [Rhizobiaceae bacterium]|nr:MAG: type II toxin-antitoxin system RelE/ParE family toxin [Rhizobiaceae bacterium]